MILRNPRWVVRFAAGMIFLLALLATGCKFFDPAQPEPPTNSGFVPRYTAPETTLVTMKLAIEDKSATNGQVAYAGAFADTAVDGIAYHAFFDPITLARFPSGQSTEWDRDREQSFYAKLSRQQPGSNFLFTWGNYHGAPDDDHEGTTALLYRSYRLLATADNQTYVPVAKGLVELYFIQSSGNWKIVRWQDHEDPTANFDIGEQSFGQLRLGLR